jgi:threonine/homoserine/homoserine lactone efflux protein
MLIGLLLKGIAVGIVIAVPVGPVGVLCIRRTIVSGRLAGFLSGMGVATADAVYGVIAFGLTFIANWLLGYKDWLRIAGAAFLLYAGIKVFLTLPHAGEPTQRDPETLFADYASTFVLTIVNPVTILAFLAIFAAIGFSGRQATLGGAGLLVLGVWLGSLVWWIGLTVGAGMLRHSFDRRHLLWINRGSGGLLVLSGLGLLASLVVHFG